MGENNTTCGWYRPDGAIPVLSGLTIHNTLYVAKNGYNSTGLRNRVDKPFLTIYAASQAAIAGDTIYILSGTYVEGNSDWVKSNVYYNFQEGCLVQNTTTCISDFGSQKNIYIFGNASFQVTGLNYSYGVVDVSNTGSVLFLRCKDIIGRSNGLRLSNVYYPYNIKCRNITVVNQYGIMLRGTSTIGSIEFKNLTVSSTGAAIYVVSVNADRVVRKVTIKGEYIYANSGSGASAILTVVSVTRTKIELDVKYISHYSTAAGGIVYADSGDVLVKNTNASGVGYGCRFLGSSIGQVQNSNIYAPTYALSIESTYVYVINSQLIGNNASTTSGAVQLSGALGQLTAKNVIMNQRGASANPCVLNLINPSAKIFLSSCILVGNALNTESIRNTGGIAFNIYIQEDCVTNIATSALLTNQITGTNVVVDSDVAMNTNNFY